LKRIYDPADQTEWDVGKLHWLGKQQNMDEN